MRCHSDVFSWVDVPDGLMYRWVDVKVDNCYLVMYDKKYQMEEFQSGSLMAQALTRRHSWINLSKWSPYGEIPHGKMLCKVQMIK